jgi:hypothetical protein
LEDWLKNVTIDELIHPIAETSRKFMRISTRSDGLLSFRVVDAEGPFDTTNDLPSLVRFGNEPDRIDTANQLVALQYSVLPGSVSRTTAAEAEFKLLLGTPPMLGELLISTWLSLHDGKSDDHGPLIETLVADTRSAFDTFSQLVLEHQTRRAVNQAIIDSNGVRVTASLASFRSSFSDLNSLEIAQVVDEVWGKLGLSSEQSIAAATQRGVKVTNPKWMGQYNKSPELSIKIVDSCDRDKNGQVTKDELFSHLSQCEPLQRIEGVSSTIAQTMLLHHFLLLLLDRPVPDLKLEASVDEEQTADSPGDNTTNADGVPELADGTGSVYGGKTYSQWRDIFRAETNSAEKHKAFQALVSFSSQPHIGQTRDVLLEYIALGNPDELMLRTADAIHGIDVAGWMQLQTKLEALPTATAARVVHSLRLLASPAVKPQRGSESPWPPSRDRVLPYFDLVQHQLSTAGNDWSVAERRNILTGLLDLVRLPYRAADEQAAIEARLWQIARHPRFDHRCWYAVRNDPFWERSAEAREQIDNAIIDSMPAQFEVSMEFMEAILAVNSLHSRCTSAQKATIVAHMDRLMQTVGIEHLRAKSGFATFLDFASRFEVALFDLPEQKFYRSDSSPKPDWEMGARQLELFSYSRQRRRDSGSVKLPVVLDPDLTRAAGQRIVWLEMHLQNNSFYYHVVDLVVLTHVRFLDELQPPYRKSGLEQLAKLIRKSLTPLMPKLAEFGVPGQNVVLNTDWAFPESSSQIYWGKRATEPGRVVVTHEQLSAMLISASVDSALRGEQPAGPIWIKNGWGNQTIPLLPVPKSSDATNEELVTPADSNKPDSTSAEQPVGAVQPMPTEAASSPALSLADTALFRGQTYRHWANVFENDRDRKTRSEAFSILLQFTDAELQAATKQLLYPELLVAHRDRDDTPFAFWRQTASSLVLNEDDWSAIEGTLAKVSAADQAWYLQSLAWRWSRTGETAVHRVELGRFLQIFQQIATTSAAQWSPEEKRALAGVLLFRGFNVQWETIEELRDIVPACWAALQLTAADWIELAQSQAIEKSEPIRTLAIQALLNELPAVSLPTGDHFEYLVLWQRMLQRASASTKTELVPQLLPWLESFRQEHWLQPWPDYSVTQGMMSLVGRGSGIRGDQILSMMSGEGGGAGAGMLGSFSGAAGSPAESPDDSLAYRWDTFRAFLVTPSGRRLAVEVPERPIFGKLIANTVWLLLKDAAEIPAGVFEPMLESSRADYLAITQLLEAQSITDETDTVQWTGSGIEIVRRAVGQAGPANRNRRTPAPPASTERLDGVSVEQIRGALLHAFVLSIQESSTVETPDNAAANRQLPGNPGISDRIALYVREMLARYDVDQDGALSFDEAQKMRRPPPESADLDGDGRFSYDELYQYYQRFYFGGQ